MQVVFPHIQAALGDALTILFTSLRCIVVYAVVLLLLRFTGKRVLGQFTPFDLVTLLLLSSAVQNAMIGPDNSVVGGLAGALGLLLVNRWASRNRKLRQTLEGQPTLLVRQGQVHHKNLEREGVSLADLRAALREHGVLGTEDVATAVLEVDGTISVVHREHDSVHHLRSVRTGAHRQG
jgi:uncharacterized membrane protein YcaP (DUF421 family)